MFTKEGIKALHAWTHECLDLVFDHAEKLPTPLFVKEMEGFGIASVRNLLAHILYCEAGWVHALQDDLPYAEWKYADYPTVASLREARKQVFAETLAYLDGLSEAQLNATVARRPKGWTKPLRSPAFILHHILTHAFHHKGQVVTMFRMLGYPAPDTDLQRAEAP